jgi:uncharacterized protein involved in exopolysaccharide biosynthesis
VALGLTVIAVGVSCFQTPVYEAPARIQLGIGLGLHVPANAPEGTAARLRTLADEIEAEGLTPSVAEEVNDATAGQGVTQQDLYTNLNIEQIEDTRILQFSYTDTDQEKARLVVNHVADAHATQIPLTNQIYYRGAPTRC